MCKMQKHEVVHPPVDGLKMDIQLIKKLYNSDTRVES